jgi:hypothetical protein
LPSVVIKSVDPERISQAVHALVARWATTFPGMEKVIWFGSWVRGDRGPASDVGSQPGWHREILARGRVLFSRTTNSP